MDETRFDHLTRFFAQIGSRRGLLGLLAALPLTGGLLGLLDEEAAAKDRRRRRKRRHKRRTGNRKKRNKGKSKNKKKTRCVPESVAQTCAGRCATVTNNCQQAVDCGPCACDPPCAVCFTCQEGSNAPGQCVVNTAVDGQACGEPGRVCTQGACRCAEAACLAAGGCCAGDTCVPTDFQTDPAHCGACQTVCATGEACAGGTCCLPDSTDLQAAIAAAIDQGESSLTLCAGTWQLTSTVTIAGDLTLRGAGAGQTVLDGGDAVTVLSIAPDAVVTVEALTITKGRATLGGGVLNDGTLTLRDADVSGNSAFGQGGGIYSNGSITLEAGSRITGNTAGQGGGGIYNSTDGTVTLEAGSRITGNTATSQGGGIYSQGSVTLENGSLVGGDAPEDANSAQSGGGIYLASNGTVTLQSGSRVAGNTAGSGGSGSGGGIFVEVGTLTLKAGSRVAGNTAGPGGGIFNQSGQMMPEIGALVCDNSAPQCSGTITPPCPNPEDGVCPPP